MVRTWWRVLDGVAAVAVLMVCAVAAQENGMPSWWRWVLVGGAALPIAVRDRWPVPAAAVTLAAGVALLVGDVIPPYAAAGLCAAVALTHYSAAVREKPFWSVPALAVAAALGLRWPAAPLVAVPVVAFPWLLGWSVGHRRRLAERIASDRADRAVAQERMRIARDMHDAVAHSLSMIAMKASVARHVAAVRPEESAAALEVIEYASREALGEMRRAVGLLREGEGAGLPSGSDEDLRALADRAEQAGLEVDLTLPTTLPDGMRLVVYRVVQEALTNVIRHAGATGCTVGVECDAGAVTVRVDDNGAAGKVPGAAGNGLRGMRERVAAYGGSVQAGPRPGGGFRVFARIPGRVAERP